jgi:hypothetical protein
LTLTLLGSAATTTAAPGVPRLVDLAEELGIHQQGLTWSATVADFNGDRQSDFYVAWHSEKPGTLYLNRGDGFDAQPLGDTRDRHDCAAADVDRDGRMDLYCTVGANESTDRGDNNLFLQTEPGKFTDVAQEWGVNDPWGRGRMTTFIDANGDSYPDLFVGNAAARADDRVTSNRLFINENGKGFRRAGGLGLDRAEGGDCAQAIDINGNGFQDLLLCAKSGLVVYFNTQGKGFRRAKPGFVPDERPRQARFLDVRGKLSPELVTLDPRSLVVRGRKKGNFQRELETAELRGAMDFAAGDIDGDGDLDLFVVHIGCQKGEEVYSHSRDTILLNNNSFFIPLPVPAPEAGCGQTVEAIDYDGDGSDEFLVLNGRGETPGYLQLIDLRMFEQ